MDESRQTFWEHLDVLRNSLLRIVVAVVLAGTVAFFFKEELFAVVLAPTSSDFMFYRWVGVGEPFRLHLVNTGLTEQLMAHLNVSMTVGLLCASPYVIYVLFRFVSPALYEHERKYSVRLLLSAYFMFMVGLLVNYFVLFPLTVRFLGNYQVSAEVENLLTLSSYIGTLLTMSLVFGALFEIPVVCWLLALFGLMRSEWMRRYRRHSIMVILVLAAIVTPTTDVFTLLIVSLPIWLLYEFSIWVVAVTVRGKAKK